MWHVDAEIISLLMMTVIIVDVFATGTARELKDKFFKALTMVTVLAILIDIISSVTMMEPQSFSWWTIQGSMLLYMIVTPLLSVLWHLYAITVIKKSSKKTNGLLYISVIPFLIYTVLVLLNPVTGILFQLSDAKEYARGELFNIIFVLFYGYALATLILAVANFRKIERTTAIILTMFPVIAGAGIYLQQILPGYLVTGASFTIVLLITYMFLQNRKKTRDSLTGLYNRLAFSEDIDKLARYDGHGFVIAVAIDEFKLFNQVFGQANGDEVLISIGEYLVDISPSKTCYRYGGDIFTLILKGPQQEAQAIADEIMKELKTFVFKHNIGYSISASLGIVEYPYLSENKNHSIVTALDFAIFQAKKRGKGQVAFYDDELIRKFARKHDVMEAITNGIDQNTFEVYLQPIYNIDQKAFVNAEALLRLNDSTIGPISPAEFIPLAEEGGKIVEITYFVLEQVCSFLKNNRDILQDKLSISVNFSVIQFMQRDMVQRVIQIVRSYDVLPELIKIEITESVVVDSFGELKTAMKELEEVGFCFALDDYGQGYSNIAYLVNLPFQYVKLDKSIIDGILEDDQFVRALIPMFKSLEKRIVAEGVEEREQAELLFDIGCDNIQGYYFTKPMPMEQTISFLKEKNV